VKNSSELFELIKDSKLIDEEMLTDMDPAISYLVEAIVQLLIRLFRDELGLNNFSAY